MKITTSFIYAIAPVARVEIVQAIVSNQNIMAKYGIVSEKHTAHFLGQCAAETAGFNRLVESLYYTTAKRLTQVWPTRFRTLAAAAPYVRSPEKLANNVYGNRLGNKRPGDGWRYRGSGMKQTTGLYNFDVVQSYSGIKCVDQPDLLRGFPEALTAACVYWKTNNLSRFADADNVKGLTKAIQGGYGGLNDRTTFTRRALEFVERGFSGDVPEQFLRNGQRGDDVRQLQSNLKKLGYDMIGKIDGIFGDATEDGVRQFQSDTGLISDGVVGPKTKITIEGYLIGTVKPVQKEPPQIETKHQVIEGHHQDKPDTLPEPNKSDTVHPIIKFLQMLWSAWRNRSARK